MKLSRDVLIVLASLGITVAARSLCPQPQSVQSAAPSGLATGAEPAAATGPALPQGTSASWWRKTQQSIREAEYHIVWQERTELPGAPGAFQAPNRAQDLRTYFTLEGIRIVPRLETGASWQWGATVAAYGYEGRVEPAGAASLSISANRVEYGRGQLTEWYINDERGIEQGFTLASPATGPRGAGPLIVEIAVTGGLEARAASDGLSALFLSGAGVEILRYGQLETFDAAGKRLETVLGVSPGRIEIRVDDREAAYPIVIDPLLTSATWNDEVDQAEAQFGYAVATAGDVNGDGYSDVIVGAPFFQTGRLDDGRAYVYVGTRQGVFGGPAWTARSGLNTTQFGYSVAAAGDVNGDGHGDIIIGSPTYEGLGAAFVWHGSRGDGPGDPGLGPEGTPENADWTATGEEEGSFFGSSVAPAGDVNGDGYGDVLIGAPWQWNGEGGRSRDGKAYLYLGSPSGLGKEPAWTASTPGAVGGSFASSVASAGDVNGDGYGDVIIGIRRYRYARGAAFLWHGGKGGLGASGTPANAAWTAEGPEEAPQFGASVGTAGDVNGDGYSDVIIGAPDLALGNDAGSASVYHGSASGLDADPAWTVAGGAGDKDFGHAVFTAGDVNGDGYADVVIGSPTHGGDGSGRAFVYQGSKKGLARGHAWTAAGAQSGAWFGFAAATAGDVNGDGYSDLIVGLPLHDGGQEDEGRASIYHGSAAGLAAAAAWRGGTTQLEAQYGFSVASAGDVNGDGYSDVIVGAPRYDTGEADGGRVFAYFGGEDGLSDLANWSAQSDQEGARFGSAVASAGDLNGDGYSDVVIGAPFHDGDTPDEGRVFVYIGNEQGLDRTFAWIAESDQEDSGFGIAVASAGDVNGDGFGDLLVGAARYDDEFEDEGQVFLWRGSRGDGRQDSGLGPSGRPANADWAAGSGQTGAQLGFSVGTAGDVNGDGFSDVIAGAYFYDGADEDEGGAFVYHGSLGGLPRVADWSATGGQEGAFLGHSVGTAGDVNRDGYADVIIGAFGQDTDLPDVGRAHVFMGSSSGVEDEADWSLDGTAASAWLGFSVATAGDVNGDGLSDVIIGVPLLDGEGHAHVYLGSVNGVSTSHWDGSAGQADAQFGWSVASAGDVNGDGFCDVIIGANHFNQPSDDEGRAFVYYGNAGDGIDRVPRQVRSDDSGLIATLGMAEVDEGFRLKALGRSAAGRAVVRLEWEVEPLGTALDGTLSRGELRRGAAADTGTPGPGGSSVLLDEPVGALNPAQAYCWRLRILGDSPFFPRSPWFTLPYNGSAETDLRTPGQCVGAAGSTDCDRNGIRDACELSGNDCNQNGVLDACDLASGKSRDADGDGIPDECEKEGAQMPGDGNQDGKLDLSDGIHLLTFLFLDASRPLPCGDGSPKHPGNVMLLDSNGDRRLDLSDPVRVFGYLFLGAPPPVLGTKCTLISGCTTRACAR